jgi:hypothetical protein
MANPFDSVIAKLEASTSNTNFYRNLTSQERATLNNNSLASNSTGSANILIRSLDDMEFQRLDYGRDTKYSVAQREDCVEQCVLRNQDPRVNLNITYNQCQRMCKEGRTDYV